MALAAIIQHHPSRAVLIPPLLEELAPLPTRVVADPDPDAPQKSPWRTYRACLEAFPEDASHALVLQDDAKLCRDFSAALPNVVATAQKRSGGDPVIALMTWPHGEQRRIPQWAQAMHRARTGPGQILALPVWNALVCVVGVVWPRSARDAFLQLIERTGAPHPTLDDYNVGYWAKECAAHLCGVIPSLIDHRNDVDRINPWPQPGRDKPDHKAAAFIGERSALEVFAACPRYVASCVGSVAVGRRARTSNTSPSTKSPATADARIPIQSASP